MENPNSKQVAVFEQKQIRRLEHEGETWFSVVDVIAILTDSPDPKNYWSKLKERDPQTLTICQSLKMKAADGKQRATDCATDVGIFRIIQSVPSPKAEPFKMWLATLGKQAIVENADPELGFDRLREIYKAKGYPDEWIERRLQSIETRKQLTDEWQSRGVKEGHEYSILTATIARATFGVAPSEHSKLKNLAKQNLRDHMTPLELIFTALSEEATRSITVRDDAQGFNDNFDAATTGGEAAGEARRNFENKTKLQVVSPTNYLKNLPDETLKDDSKTE